MALTRGAESSGSLAAGSEAEATGASSALLLLFFVTLLIPIQLNVGPLRMDPYRLFLMIFIIPALVQVLSGKAGRVIPTDYFMLVYNFWILVSLVFNHGLPIIEYAGMTGIELMGGYLAGRLLVRSLADFVTFFRYFFYALLFLMPFALYELFTKQMIIAKLLDPIFTVTKKNNAVRMGLSRVQAVFPHSILYGVFCSVGLANMYYLYKNRFTAKVQRCGTVVGMTFMSLSSGPLLSVALQCMMIGWDWITKGKWKLLVILSAIAYVVVDLLSNRTPLIILIETVTFSSGTGWTRIHIFRYGSEEVWRHPIFGIGLNDWERPFWLTGSVDNFWLLNAMRHGLPGFLTLVTGIGLHMWNVLKARNLTERGELARTGYLVSMVGLFMTLGTVHVWSAMSVFVMFLIGAGSWFYTEDREPLDEDAETAAETPRTGGRSARQSSRKPAAPAPTSTSRSGATSEKDKPVRRYSRAPTRPRYTRGPPPGKGPRDKS
jgi:hypothetical protein